MAQRSAFQVQVFEKIGAPLMAAVSDVSARQEGGDAPKQEAERVAELLGKTVQASISLASSMGLKDTDGQSDSIRLALAALAGPLVAGYYRVHGKIPGDSDIKRMVKALEAVLTFADNFAPAAENTARLESLKPGALADENQISIQYVHVLVPVVNAVTAFSFGRAENKLVQEIAGKLVDRAAELARSLAGDAPEKAARQAELGLLGALASVFAACYEDETRRLMALDDVARTRAAEEAGGAMPLDPVWKAFDARVAMIELVAQVAVSGGAAAAGGSAAPVPASPPALPPERQPAPEAPPAAAEPGMPQEEEGEAEDTGAYNPMGFFKPANKKTADGEGRA